jgi:hypothetical protein
MALVSVLPLSEVTGSSIQDLRADARKHSAPDASISSFPSPYFKVTIINFTHKAGLSLAKEFICFIYYYRK